MKKIATSIITLFLLLITITPAFAVRVERVYGFINTSVFDTVYSYSISEEATLRRAGWFKLGMDNSWLASVTEGVPVYRLYNPLSQRHLFTLDENEVQVLTSQYGWVVDHNGQPIFYSSGSVPVYRVYNTRYGYHQYVVGDEADLRNTFQPQGGWSFEGIKLYGYK